MSNIIEKLTENIVARDLSKEGAALVNKWEKTGLLEGLGNERDKDNMSRLLENQAKELLREASTMAAGDVEGFAAVAFPIVRRVFGGLLANDLVSVQPMSLPSGLIFFLDFTKDTARLGNHSADKGSVYGGDAVGKQITGGIDLGRGKDEVGFYNLNNGYSSPVSGGIQDVAPADTMASDGASGTSVVISSGAFNADGRFELAQETPHTSVATKKAGGGWTGGLSQLQAEYILRSDPDIASGAPVVILATSASSYPRLNKDNLVAWTHQVREGSPLTATGSTDVQMSQQLRRLTGYMSADLKDSAHADRDIIYSVIVGTGTINAGGVDSTKLALTNLRAAIVEQLRYLQFPTSDAFQSTEIGGVGGTAGWLLESDTTTFAGTFTDDSAAIPEIDIKVDSVAVTAITKKLRAKWSPELGQDLNAYHNLDAEVELTGILSEQVALEIDREILEDLIKRATGGTLYWSRNPGQFLNKETGVEVGASAAAPDFTGTVSEWYETLLETVNDVSARIHRKTLRGGANFIVTSPEVASILEFTAGFRASVTVDSNGTAGANKTGSISKKFDVYVDPYFPRNLVLVGRKGSSFLESGYVYAPYVPLQVTPTIFGTEDFAPRKGVMTRYAKKMVRPDMYGLVVVRGLIGSSGATA